MSPSQPNIRNPNRRRVLHHVEANPGACVREIVGQLGITRTAVTHHLRALERMGMVTFVRQGRRKLLFSRGSSQLSSERTVLGLLRQESARSILESLYADPTRSWRRVAAELGVTPHTVRWHVARLQEKGLIHVLQRGLKANGHMVHFHPTVRLSLEAAAQARPSPVDLADRLEAAPLPAFLPAANAR